MGSLPFPYQPLQIQDGQGDHGYPAKPLDTTKPLDATKPLARTEPLDTAKPLDAAEPPAMTEPQKQGHQSGRPELRRTAARVPPEAPAAEQPAAPEFHD